MIYITGDTHIPIDIKKLNAMKFPQQKAMTKNDYVIIVGDFGGIWDGSREEQYWLKWFTNKKFTTLFIDGNHENFTRLNAYPVSEWNGGKVHKINDSIIHLMRGQVYTIEGLKFFTMGGAQSTDKLYRIEGKSWWPEELPSKEEYDEAISNLDKHNWTVDYILTHSTSSHDMKHLCYVDKRTELDGFLDMLEEYATYRHWYFGHFHADETIREKHTVVYNEVHKIT